MNSFDVKYNVSYSDYFRSYIPDLLYPLKVLQRYRKTYKNFLEVFFKNRLNNFPIKAILRNGNHLILNNKIEVVLTAFGVSHHTDLENNILILNKKEFNEIKLLDWEENGDLYGIFCQNDYKSLPVSGAEVIDIGANICDSSIYFAKLGAKKVIALEPSPINYESAKKNIELNNLSKKIELLLAACNSQDGNIKVDSNKKGVKLTLQKNITSKMEIPCLSLDSILKRCANNIIVLKMDCEGCEYETILSSPDETLKKISFILLEYHYGYINLKLKLENCGFKVRVTKPARRKNVNLEKSSAFEGYLFAENFVI